MYVCSHCFNSLTAGYMLKHLRHAKIDCQDFTLEMAEALAPALNSLVRSEFGSCSPNMTPLAAAVGCSEKLLYLSFSYRDPEYDGEAPFVSFLSTWGGGLLHSFTVLYTPRRVFDVVLAALKDKTLLAREVYVEPGDDVSETSDFDDYICPCEQRW